MFSPFLWLGCAAVGGHAWGEPYEGWAGRRVRHCRWCEKTETA